MALHPDFQLTDSKEKERQTESAYAASVDDGFGHSGVRGSSTMVISSCASYECKGR